MKAFTTIAYWRLVEDGLPLLVPQSACCLRPHTVHQQWSEKPAENIIGCPLPSLKDITVYHSLKRALTHTALAQVVQDSQVSDKLF